MGKKQHHSLCESFEDRFPQLFGFEMCGLLFIDAADGSLFKIATDPNVRDSMDENSKNPEKTGTSTPKVMKPIIVRLPKDRGITGLAISTKTVQLVSNGEYHLQYAGEVDNSVSCRIVNNCLVGPCYDSEG